MDLARVLLSYFTRLGHWLFRERERRKGNEEFSSFLFPFTLSLSLL
jgi:hypothetical protein